MIETVTERPEGAANRALYADLSTRRARVVVEVDVEWREDDPDYSFGLLRTGELDSGRVRGSQVVSVEWVHGSTPPPKVSVEVWEDGERADATVADVVRIGDTWHVVASLDG